MNDSNFRSYSHLFFDNCGYYDIVLEVQISLGGGMQVYEFIGFMFCIAFVMGIGTPFLLPLKKLNFEVPAIWPGTIFVAFAEGFAYFIAYHAAMNICSDLLHWGSANQDLAVDPILKLSLISMATFFSTATIIVFQKRIKDKDEREELRAIAKEFGDDELAYK